jgi:hypothetical protein
MKCDKFLGKGIFTVVLVFGFGLMACDTGNGGITSSTAEALAAKLATDLNAIEAGSATAAGATVTLSDNLELDSNLTVPAGVTLTVPVGSTLDVTASGAALSLGNATLTVNGTVHARSNAVRLEDSTTTATINGSGTIRLNSKGVLLRIAGNSNGATRKIILDGVTLTGLADNSDQLVNIREGGELVLKSGVISGNTVQSGEWAEGGGVCVEGGTFTMKGGAISGNTADSGGGVEVHQGTFTMEGGSDIGSTDDTLIAIPAQ